MSALVRSSVIRGLLVAVTAAFACALASTATLAEQNKAYSGTLPDGASYLIEVPPVWHGTLLLYSHGYRFEGQENPPRDAGDSKTAAWLLNHGYALAGSSYSTTGFAVKEAVPDQIALLDLFPKVTGSTPKRTVAWGHSLGGLVTAMLIERYPRRFVGALPMCGVVGGGVATWNLALDFDFVTKRLLAPRNPLALVHIHDPKGEANTLKGILLGAQKTAVGRARIALAADLAGAPGWFDPSMPQPAPKNYAGRQLGMYRWTRVSGVIFGIEGRAELERRAGGNPSWNTGIDYRSQFERSANRDLVYALYKQAGLDLDEDFKAIDMAPRISADPGAVAYLAGSSVPAGRIGIPVLTLHTTGDGLIVAAQEQSYRAAVGGNGDGALLRQLYVHRAGHCAFTSAETIMAVKRLISRLDSGSWGDLRPAELNGGADQLLGFNTRPTIYKTWTLRTNPAYVDWTPPVLLRPRD